ncbi:MAG TPA: peptidoglycan editing factor PgeF [Thermoanaerobaculia bacterium]
MFRVTQSSVGRIVVPSTLPAGFALFYTTRDFPGRLSGGVADDLTSVIRDHFGLETSLITCNQVHGATVTRVKSEKGWRECDSCDALWSDQNHVALGIKVADCLPVTMLDSTHSVLANVHSGWRGAVARITASTVDAITAASAFDPTTAHAYLGPSIRVCCFEVGEEVAAQFDDQYLDRSRGSKPHVDLVAYTADILRARGFDGSRIFDSEMCTRCDDSLFHSYRRDAAASGRNLSIVAQ